VSYGVIPSGGMTIDVITERVGDSLRGWLVQGERVAPVPDTARFFISEWVPSIPEGTRLWRINLVISHDIDVRTADARNDDVAAVGEIRLLGDPSPEQLRLCGLLEEG
jgi:hypothetical protein